METSIPLVLEEELSWSPFANDWENLNHLECSLFRVV